MKDVNSLYGLAFDCPYYDRQDDCPLKEIEQLPLREKVNWINSLSKDRKLKMIEKHKNCSKNRV
jgi:hypothetical protein